MRAICTGDLHFGAGGKFSDDRLGEQKAVWRAVLDLAWKRECPVIVAGDVFHRPRPTPAEQEAFFWPIAENGNVVVYVCPGNHDWLAVNQPTELAVWRGQIPNLRVIDRPEVGTVDRDTLVGWLPWTPPHLMQAAQPGVSRDDLNVQIAEQLLLVAGGLRDQGAEVLVAHWSVSNALLAHGGLVQEFLREPILPLHDLVALDFEAVVLGHIHRHQVLAAKGGKGDPVFYVGSPMPLDFGEGEYDHGVVLLDTAGSTTLEFLPIESRPFLTIDHRENPNAAEALAFMLDNQAVQVEVEPGAIVRLRYRATREAQAKIDVAALARKIERAGASRVYVLPEIVKSTRTRTVVEEDLGPLEAVQAWLDANDYVHEDEGGRTTLLDLTNELLGEVGVA